MMNVQIEAIAPLLSRDLVKSLLLKLLSRVENKNVESTEDLDCLFDGLLAVVFTLHVEGEKVNLTLAIGLLRDVVARVFSVLLFFREINDGRVGAFDGVEDGGSASDARVATLYDSVRSGGQSMEMCAQ